MRPCFPCTIELKSEKPWKTFRWKEMRSHRTLERSHWPRVLGMDYSGPRLESETISGRLNSPGERQGGPESDPGDEGTRLGGP